MIESTNPAGSTKQMAQTGCENAVAGVDGILHVANEMSEADLIVFFRPAHLAAVAVRDPEIGAEPFFLDHLLPASASLQYA